MSEERRLILWLLVFAALAAFVYILRGALFPFIAGMAVAYLLDPVADWLERFGVPRLIASLLIVLVFILALAAVLVVLVPILIDQVMDLVARAPGYIDNLRREVTLVVVPAGRLRNERACRRPCTRSGCLVRSHPMCSTTLTESPSR